jgi:hypothetical protein
VGSIVFGFCSCSKINKGDCEDLSAGITAEDLSLVNPILDPILKDYMNNSQSSDEIGYKDNLEHLIGFINENCTTLNFDISCYTCFITYSPQSAISAQISWEHHKILDINMPKNGN